MVDNAFTRIADFPVAQQLSDNLDIPRLHGRLDAYAQRCCPVAEPLDTRYHWSLSQVEYATDIIFKDPEDLRHFYAHVSRDVILALQPERIAAFFGREFPTARAGEAQTHFITRSQGTCVKHTLWPVSIKMYDKYRYILRIETATDDVAFFKHHRKVEQKDGREVYKNAPVRKFIYSLPALAPVMLAANFRYLDLISQLDDPTPGCRRLEQVCQPKVEKGRNYRGLNFFDPEDHQLLRAIASGELLVNGMRNKYLRWKLDLSPAQISRRLKGLRVHGLIRKVRHSYKYYLTALGRRVIAAGLKLKELFLVPELAMAFKD